MPRSRTGSIREATDWLGVCCTFSCPDSSVRPVIWVAFSLRSSYWTPAEVVHCVPSSEPDELNTWLMLRAALRFRLDDLLVTTVPGCPSAFSYWSSGGEIKSLSCWK